MPKQREWRPSRRRRRRSPGHNRDILVTRAVGNAANLLLKRIALILLLSPYGVAHAQDMEPRAYSASPIDGNFLLAGYLRTTGAVSLDPALPIANVRASINTEFLGYDRTFALFGDTASAAIVIP